MLSSLEVGLVATTPREMGRPLKYTFEPGDLLFQGLGFARPPNAITEVTSGYEGAELDHVAIYIGPQSSGVIVEAFYPVVRYNSLQKFLSRRRDEQGRPSVLIGRMRERWQPLVPAALEEAKNLVGLPYDQVFGSGEQAYYCSELVVDSFKYANNGATVFAEEPMSFSNPETGEVTAYWTEYFKWLGVPVPARELGSNPGSLSRSKVLSIVDQLGSVVGLPLN